MNYFEHPLFCHIYLEDSYVMSIKEENNNIIFDIDAVLTEENPFYQSPRDGEQYCYRRANLIFYDIFSLEWIKRSCLEFKDASGSVDCGNIDTFTINNEIYTLSGDWGAVKFGCKKVDFNFTDISNIN